MEAFIIYILKACVAIAILFIAYLLLLKNEKFFKLNRFILLVTLLLPFILPLLPSIRDGQVSQLQHDIFPFYSFGAQGSANDPSIAPAAALPEASSSETSSDNNRISWMNIFTWLYLLITSLMLSRFIIQLSKLYRLIRRNTKVVLDNIKYCEHTEELVPFSFLNFLVINRSSYSPEELKQIIIHERSHIRQWHTIDILLAEIIHAFLWINPFIPLIKRHIRLNLEYIADENVLESGIDRKGYQLSILNNALIHSPYSLTNLFHSSKLKLRIKMMNAKKSSRGHLLRYLFVLPMIAAAYFSVNPVMAGQSGNKISYSDLQDLKPLEGYYQFEKDNDSYVQILVKDNRLVLKQLWDQQEISFERESGLSFINKERDFSIVFSRGENGDATSLLAFGRDKWNKVKEYKPVVKKEVQLSAEQIGILEGMYKMKDNPSDLYLQFTAKGNHMVVKEMWTGKEIIIAPESSVDFFGKEIKYPVKFIKDNKGVVTAVIVFDKDVWEKIRNYQPKKEVTLNPRDLRTFEGKYRFQFEKDKYSFIQVTIEGNGLLVKSLWNNKEMHFVPESALSFFSPDLYLTARFTRNESGKITNVFMLNKDLWEKMD